MKRRPEPDDARVLKWAGGLGHTHVITCDSTPDPSTGSGSRRVTVESCNSNVTLEGENPRLFERTTRGWRRIK